MVRWSSFTIERPPSKIWSCNERRTAAAAAESACQPWRRRHARAGHSWGRALAGRYDQRHDPAPRLQRLEGNLVGGREIDAAAGHFVRGMEQHEDRSPSGKDALARPEEPSVVPPVERDANRRAGCMRLHLFPDRL